MKLELNQEELNLLIESVTDSKNYILKKLEEQWDYDYIIEDNISDLTNYLANLYYIKNKICNYSIAYQEEN